MEEQNMSQNTPPVFDENKFRQQFEEERKKYAVKKVNILLCGYTGSGKSSLARAILGDVVPESAIGTGAPKTMGYEKYENDLVCIWDSKGLETGETEEEFMQATQDFIRKQQENPNVDNHIHLFWYTIQGPGARVTDCDKHLMTKIFNPNHIFVLLTKADAMRDPQKQAMKDELIKAGIRESRIFFTTDAQGGALGCKELMEASLKELPEAYRDAFIQAQILDVEKKIQAVKAKAGKARAIIATAASAAAAAGGLNPFPLSDAALITPIQLTMLASLAAVYGFAWEKFKPAVLPFILQSAGKAAATSLLKLIPGLGHVVNAGVAASLTWGVGLFMKNYMEKCSINRIEGKPEPEFVLNSEIFQEYLEMGKKEQKLEQKNQG